MAMSDESCGPDNPKCWNGKQGKINQGKPMFSFKRKKKTTDQTIPATPNKSAGLNMNMRNIGDNPGDVRPRASNNKTSLSASQTAQGAADQTEATKKRTILGFKRRVQ